uniref:Uncharacterized protein n=1 Tax=Schistosoma curassoni TaxID=6186 RepID=A0A183JP42_9TREM
MKVFFSQEKRIKQVVFTIKNIYLNYQLCTFFTMIDISDDDCKSEGRIVGVNSFQGFIKVLPLLLPLSKDDVDEELDRNSPKRTPNC